MSKQINYHYVMSRMEWFRDLKLIFNKLLSDEDILKPVEKCLLIKELNSRSSKLELKSPEDYNQKSKLQAFSLTEIFAHIDTLDSTVNFDQLIDSLIYLSIDKKKKEKKITPEVTEKTFMSEPTEKIHKAMKSMNEINLLTVNSKEIQEKTPISLNLNPNLKQPTDQKIIKKIQPVSLKSPSFDSNFPESKLLNYPDLSQYENLQFLYLAGNNLSDTNFPFPSSLVVLNLSSNKISELKFSQEMKNLQLLNLTSNQISRIFSVNQIKGVKELLIANNCITTVNLLCHLSELHLLDCSHNEISTFEDIAGLVISKRLGILKLRGNPVSSKESYEKIVTSLLPRIYNFDPVNIVDFSIMKQLGSQPFVPLKSLNEDFESRQQSDRFSVKSNKSEKMITPSFKFQEQSPGPAFGKYQKTAKTPVLSHQNEKIKRSNSQIRIERAGVMVSTSKTSIQAEKSNYFNETHEKDLLADNFIDLAERRIKVFKDKARPRHNISVISNESIQNVKKKGYGNPVAAMMIGPPAVGLGKARTKTPCFSVDLSKIRKK